jgi:hypothetical protein
MKMSSIQILLVLAIHYDCEVHQMDIKIVFLNGYLEGKIYIKQPKGFIQTRKDYLVYKLHNCLYGLKQSPHMWYDGIDTYLIKIGCQQYTTDTNVYTKKSKEFINNYCPICGN